MPHELSHRHRIDAGLSEPSGKGVTKVMEMKLAQSSQLPGVSEIPFGEWFGVA
jgi:hypothetical protein